jgi:5'-3' exonuclease
MGVKGLYSYLRPYRHVLDVSTIPTTGCIGVDALSILYKFRGNTEMILHFLEPFQSVGCTVLFVFDGKPPDTKKEEVDSRKAKRNDAREEATALKTYLDLPETKASLDERGRKVIERKIHTLENGEGWYITRDARHAFQDVLRSKKIAFVKARGEADDVLMSLWSDNKLISIVSSDMDFLVAGVERLWIPTMTGCEEVILSAVLEKEDLSMMAFRDAAILCGVSTGYVFLNMYPQKAFTFMRHYGSLERLAEKQPRQFSMDRPDLLAQIRARFLLFVKAEELVRSDYRDVIMSLTS